MTGSVVDGYNYATISPVLITPFSRGNVTISSADMSDYPVINPNWLNTPEDKDIAIAGFKRARQVWENMGNVTIGEEYFPGPNVSFTFFSAVNPKGTMAGVFANNNLSAGHHGRSNPRVHPKVRDRDLPRFGNVQDGSGQRLDGCRRSAREGLRRE